MSSQIGVTKALLLQPLGPGIISNCGCVMVATCFVVAYGIILSVILLLNCHVVLDGLFPSRKAFNELDFW